MPENDLPECPEHAHLPVRLEKIKSFYAETGTLIPQDIEYLIGQAEWAIRLDQAGEALNQSSSSYIAKLEEGYAELEKENAELKKRNLDLGGKLAHETYGNKILRENMNKLTDGKAFPTE